MTTDTDVSNGDANEAFAELGRIVLGDEPLPGILERVVHVATRVLPSATEASITLISADNPFTVAFTGERAIALDERQYEVERGPCLDSATSAQLIPIPDMSQETRWPAFARTAEELGIHSSLSVPLPIQRDLTGALNFYSSDLNGFDDRTVELAQTFAGHAAVAVANAHLYETTAALADQMKQAMESRAVIEQAKGIIMREQSCDANEAFDTLVRMSQQSHVKLRELAQRIVDEVGKAGSTSGE
jgi:GAF domain-containing protein